MMDSFEIERLIRQLIPDAHVDVRDLTGGGDHFELNIKSSAFKGKSLVEQHRLVYQALGEAMNGPIHAVQIITQAV